MSNSSDATHVYRGYRQQALYTLFRIFEADGDEIIFQPEGAEDLSIYDTQDNLIEVVQVKSYGSNLTFSDFKPYQGDSFFYRVDKLLKLTPNLSIKIASYGTVGPELHQALTTQGRERQRVAHKLSQYNLLSEEEAQTLFGNISVTTVDEDNLTENVYSFLRNSVASSDPEAAFELLHYWLFICSERKTKITRQDVIDRVNRVGKFAAERTEYYSQWFTAIVPIEDHKLDDEVRAELAEEFYLGVATKYGHILADLDMRRTTKLEEIARKFEDTRIVIVHGASGQGKTTLAYRYLYEHFPSQWRLQVKLVENKQHALRLATALVGQADAIDIPLAVYLDVGASDRDWPDLVKQLAAHRNIYVLVTIREEDFNRASITGATVRFEKVPLTFEEPEARELYHSLVQRQISAQFLSFEDAWRTFGGAGPLMEFVYLVTQGNLLYERLSEQVARLEEEARTNQLRANELVLLRLVSVAAAFDAQLRAKLLANSLGLASPKRTFKYFEKEYLIRLSEGGSLVQGLHPIRSAMLCELLTDSSLSPWVENAQACLPFIYEPDIEVFLLHAFSRRQDDIKPLLDALHSYQTEQWVALAGGVRALIWLGVREYVKANQALIREAFADSGEGWSVFLDLDIADAMPGLAAENWKTFSTMVTEQRRQQLKAMQDRQTDKRQIFVHAQAWLATRSQKPVSPLTDEEWIAMAETLFWVGRLEVIWPVSDWLIDVPFATMIDSLPLEVLGDVVLGMSQGYPKFYDTWSNIHRQHLAARFRQATQTIVLEDDGEKIAAHFIVELEQSSGPQSVMETRVKAAKDRLHEEALIRIDIMRHLFPDHEVYACQGYGHKVWSPDVLSDETKKTGIARRSLPLSWLTSVNTVFRGLVEYEFRPNTWPEYAQIIFNLRQDAIVALKQLTSGLEQYFRSQQFFSVLGNVVNAEGWENCSQRLNIPPLLPACVLDEWGLIDEYANATIAQEMQSRASFISKNGLAIQAYKPFLDGFRSYTTSLSNFFRQSIHVMIINPSLGRNAKDGVARTRILAYAEGEGLRADLAHLSTYNFADVLRALPPFQREFRQLLGHYVADAELAHIERQEQHFYRHAWYLWYFFAAQPYRKVQNPQSLIGQATDSIKRIRNGLQHEFRTLLPAEVEVRIASEKALWNFEPALWLTINSEDPVAIYQAFDDVLEAIRRAVRKVPGTELRRYVLDFLWPHVVIIPLVHGKSLTTAAWRLRLPILLQESELKWWNNFQSQIPPEAQAELEIMTWQDERLDPAFKYLISTTELSLYAAHISDFLNIPETDEEGMAQMQTYISQVSEQLEVAFQSVLDAGSIMTCVFNELSDEERANRPHLISAVQALREMQSSLLPNENFQGEIYMTVTDIAEWAERLKRAREFAGLVYLFWVSDALDISISPRM